jgi:hypothetical protein
VSIIFEIIVGTPKWVFVLFGFLVYRGVKSLSSRTVYFASCLVMPIIFMVISAQSLLSNYGCQSKTVLLRVCAIVVGFTFGCVFMSFMKIEADKKCWLIKIPGSFFALIMSMFVFSIKYFFGYHAKVNPAILVTWPFVVSKYMFSGVMFGLSISRLVVYLYKYHKAEHADLKG